MQQILTELKRRNVYRVAVAYAAVAFVTLQAARLIFPATTLEGLYDELVVLAFVGFPIALVIAWAFELTPEGVRRTREAEPSGEGPEPAQPAPSRSRRALGALVGLGAVAAAVAGGWYLLGAGGEPSSPAAAPADSARSTPRAGERSIAVLPFDNLSGTEEAEPFVNGIHDDLLTRLSNVSDVKVISRTSVLPYRETELSLPAIADSLGVRWIVEGGMQQAGDRVQVNAQLIQAAEDVHRRAETYRRELTTENLFDVQAELTKKIARSLEAELSPAEAERIERRPTEDMGAYRLYVRGRSQLNTRTAEGMRKALGYFRRAIEQDSGYALAWSGLADALGLAPAYLDSLPSAAPDQETAARRALDLAPGLAEAHAAMGYVRFLDRRAPEALLELERAVRLKPSYAQAHHWLGYLLMTIGRLDEAGDHVRLAVELDPGHASGRGVLALLHQAEGDPGRALAETRRIGAEVFWRPYIEVSPLIQLRRWSELDSLLSRLPEDPPHWATDSYRALIAAGTGDSARARELLRRSGPNVEGGWEELRLRRAIAYATLGDRDAAFAVLSRIEEWGRNDPVIALRYFYPEVLGPLREDPRYEALLREANRAWGLNPDGTLPDSADAAPGPGPGAGTDG